MALSRWLLGAPVPTAHGSDRVWRRSFNSWGRSFAVTQDRGRRLDGLPED
ncbi:hypothetical protein [Streptomyces sp. NPDC101149]